MLAILCNGPFAGSRRKLQLVEGKLPTTLWIDSQQTVLPGSPVPTFCAGPWKFLYEYDCPINFEAVAYRYKGTEGPPFTEQLRQRSQARFEEFQVPQAYPNLETGEPTLTLDPAIIAYVHDFLRVVFAGKQGNDGPSG